ncbi:PRAME family member 18-like [Apodemus sylvaticus]|uniref:PRAME family member 18-like n=1 Tax=Apodemus sylvaticus TaxID=10129 RepID=UPI0022424554|nr:PRAME family member 18-like [Apodemus sylvaticus]
MSIQTAPTLKKLAIQSLVRDEDLAISSLEELPSVLFPALFKEAFTGRQTKLIKAMLEAWPFPCLPVGALMKMPKLEMLQALLDGIDMQITQGFHSSRGKLQVLDLRNVHHAFWNIWAGTEDDSCSSEPLDEKPVVTVPEDTLGDPLHHSLPNFTVIHGFLFLQSEPLSVKTSGNNRSDLIWF